MGIDTILADHRSLTAERRRDVMRMRLIRAALYVFATRGRGGVVIADVIKAADVSRGTFYNYYRSTENLLADACHELSAEVVLTAAEATVGIASYDARFAAGVHHVLAMVEPYPVFGHFVGHLGIGLYAPQLDLTTLVRAMLAEGQAAGCFAFSDLSATCDMIEGSMIAAIAHHAPTAQYRRAVVEGLLRMLAVPAARAEDLAALTYPPVVLPAEALLSVAQNDADMIQQQEVDNA